MRDFQLPGRSPVIALNGMCATSHPIAAQTAVRILEEGGNAVDAAIAAAVLLGICEPMMTGIGGDCFALIQPPGEEKVIALNGSGRAPAGLDAAELRENGLTSMPLHSAASVTVPGAIDAFCRLSTDWGKLGMDVCLAPAIAYAVNGVPAAPRTAFDWKKNQDVLQGDARRFYLNAGKATDVGQVFRHPQQAEVLSRIAKHGRSAFYEGEVAEDMVSSLRALGGQHTLDDFAATECEYSDAISGDYKGNRLIEHPPNGQGATAILMAKILSHFDLGTMDPHGALRAHIEAEAAKLAYDARDRFIGDITQSSDLEYMLSNRAAEKLATLIDPRRATPHSKISNDNVHKDTVYLTVVDQDQMAVSLIYSIYHAFGSGIASSKFGILMQNRGAGFTLEENHLNEAGPRKRAMHTIIPGMIKSPDQFTMPFGVMGGAYQPNGHARVLTNMVDYGMSPQEAVDAPRSFSYRGEMKVERGYTAAVRQELADMGHNVIVPDVPLGGAQAILIDHKTGTLHGASDPRKDGAAIGY